MSLPPALHWGSEVIRGQVNGHDCLLYSERPDNIGDVLDASLRWADREYIIHGDRRVTFGEHHGAVGRVARRLRDAGVRPGSRVAIYARNSAEWVVVFFAVLRIGAVSVPFNGWWSSEELAHAAQVVPPDLAVVDARGAERWPASIPSLLIHELVDETMWAVTADGADEPSDTAAISEDRPAVILFTAGTTSFPKGAVLSHRALIANLQTLLVVSRRLPDQVDASVAPSASLVGLPLFHVGAIQLILFPLMAGTKIVFLPGRFDPEEVLRLVAAEGVTMFSGVPTMMERLLRAVPSGAHSTYDSLRTVVLGGSPVSEDLLSRVYAAFPNTRRRVGQTYGLTEAGGVVSTGVGAQIEAHPGSAGRIAPVVEVKVDQPDADGVGEILFRSPAAMDGYWGLPEDEIHVAGGWLRTGDIGRTDQDGFLYIVGRSKDVIIRGGENIAAARVEAVIQADPRVLEVAVIGLPDSDLGEEVAAVVRVDGTVDVMDLSAWAAPRLAQFELPSRWWLRDGPLPMNDSGKVLKSELVAEWRRSDGTEGGPSRRPQGPFG